MRDANGWPATLNGERFTPASIAHAPATSSIAAASVCPCWEATYRGVPPPIDVVSMELIAEFSRSTATNAADPRLQATNRGVVRFSGCAKFTSAPCASSCRATAT
eukprot:80403-Prymnesium_polylepis.2